jgi:hypothetical protein
MINVTVLKYGNAYSSTYVNNFYKTLKQKTNVPFKFWVQTENEDGIDSEIGILKIHKLDPVGRRFHKIDLFEEPLLSGKCFHFDLDMIINKNIDHYLNYNPKQFTCLYASYKDPVKIMAHNINNPTNKDTMSNSSIFCWNVGCDSTKRILEKHYSLDQNSSIQRYRYMSFDRFIFNDCLGNFDFFPFRDYTTYKKSGLNKNYCFVFFSQTKEKIFQYLNYDDPHLYS